MKSNRFGRAEVLDSNQLDLLIEQLPDKTHKPLAQVLRGTACRVSEARQLKWYCISPSHIILPKEICKRKLTTREIPLSLELLRTLNSWRAKWSEIQGHAPEPNDYLFPGRDPDHPISRKAFDKALRTATQKIQLQGASSHSFRRSALSSASSKGVPLRQIQEISGHKSLAVLQRYLEVTDQQKAEVIDAFA